MVEVGTEVSGFTIKLANEHLGGTGVSGEAVQTPLATGHKFNGFADVFLATPPAGLEDLYLSVGTTIADVQCSATYHDFESDAGGLDYGNELDLVLGYELCPAFAVGVKFASFDGEVAQGFGDVDKLMGWFNWTVL